MKGNLICAVSSRNQHYSSLSFFLTGTFAHADTLRVIKVYVIKSTKLAKVQTGISSESTIDNMEVDVPTDNEMNTALEALKKAGIKPEDLVKNEDHAFMLESFMFEVKKSRPERETHEASRGEWGPGGKIHRRRLGKTTGCP